MCYHESIMAFAINNEILRDYIASLNIPVSEDAVRLFGIRGALPYGDCTELSLNDNTLDLWNDTIGIWGGDWATYKSTVDPGIYYTQNPEVGGGAAHLLTVEEGGKPWHFVWGQHKGQYKCLVQGEEFTVRRDTDQNGKGDDGEPLDTGWHAIQIHHGSDSAHVYNWSAGCNVIRDPDDFAAFIATLEASGQTTFAYYLIDGTALAKHLGLLPA